MTDTMILIGVLIFVVWGLSLPMSNNTHCHAASEHSYPYSPMWPN